MSVSDFEELQISSFINVTGFGWQPPTLSADFGGGYGAGCVVAPYGLRRWRLQAEVMPDTDDYSIDFSTIDGDFTLPRFSYFLDFFQRHLMLGNKPFIIRDPRTEKKYLVSFPESVVKSGMDAPQITAKVLAGSTSLVERRVSGITFNTDGSIDLDYAAPTGSLSVSGSSPYFGTVTITATVSDNVAIDKVEFFIDYELLSTDLSSGYTASWDTTLHKNGTHKVRAKVYDTNGNVRTISIEVEIANTPDPYPPSVPVFDSFVGPSTGSFDVIWIPSSDEGAYGAAGDDDYLL